MNDLVSQKLVQIADQLQDAVIVKGPAAIQLTMKVVQLTALQNVLIIIFLIGSAISGGILMASLDEPGTNTISIVSFFVLLFSMSILISSMALFSIIGIWHPDIYIAHQLLNKVTG
jgi:hypothetical protein